MTALSVDNLLQVGFNGLVAGTAYALPAVGLGLILGVSGRFHVAFAVTYTLAAFVAAWLGTLAGWPFWAAFVAGALAASVVGLAMEVFVYRPLALTAIRTGGNIFLMTFVASLGLSIIGRNLIALSVLGTPSVLIAGFSNARVNLGRVSTTSLDLAMLVTSWVLLAAVSLLLARTTFGRMVRAVRSNWQMSLCTGIDPRAIYLAVFALGSFLGGIAAVFQATKTSATPDMGLVPLFYALVVAFLAGLRTAPWLVGVAAVALGLVQNYSSLFLPTQWTPLVAFAILFVYVALRPLDLGRLIPARGRRAARAV